MRIVDGPEVVPEDEPLLLCNVPQGKGGAQGRLVEDVLRAEEVVKRIEQCALPRVGGTDEERHAARFRRAFAQDGADRAREAMRGHSCSILEEDVGNCVRVGATVRSIGAWRGSCLAEDLPLAQRLRGGLMLRVRPLMGILNVLSQPSLLPRDEELCRRRSVILHVCQHLRLRVQVLGQNE